MIETIGSYQSEGPREFSQQQLNLLCQFSYGVGRGDSMAVPGEHSFGQPALGSYRVLDCLYCPSNGFEGMIAAPVTPEGQTEYSSLAVVFAGTNLKDDARKDLPAMPGTFIWPWNSSFGQADQAELLLKKAQYIADKQAVPTARIMLTGHSLGGGLALLLAIRYDLPARVFCSVDPWRVLSRAHKAKAVEAAERGQLVDFRLNNDRLTGPLNHLLSGQANHSARVVWCGPGSSPLGHWLGNFTFDSQGSIVPGANSQQSPHWPAVRYWLPRPTQAPTQVSGSRQGLLGLKRKLDSRNIRHLHA